MGMTTCTRGRLAHTGFVSTEEPSWSAHPERARLPFPQDPSQAELLHTQQHNKAAATHPILEEGDVCPLVIPERRD